MSEHGARIGEFYGIPAGAHAAWSELAQVLAVDGPAPCEEGAPDAWWPARAGDVDDAALAARCCVDCPARVECLAYALAADERDGIWGGLTPDQRASLGRPLVA